MQAKRVALDVVTLNGAIDAYVRCGSLPKAQGILNAMKKEALRRAEAGLSLVGSLAPVTSSYNTIIKGYGQRGDLEAVLFFVDDMKKLHERTGALCQPNDVTVNSLLRAYVKSVPPPRMLLTSR